MSSNFDVKIQYLLSTREIETVNATRAVIESMFILSRKVHLERFYRDLKNEVLVGLSDTEYVNDELTFTYIQHFERQSRRT